MSYGDYRPPAGTPSGFGPPSWEPYEESDDKESLELTDLPKATAIYKIVDVENVLEENVSNSKIRNVWIAFAVGSALLLAAGAIITIAAAKSPHAFNVADTARGTVDDLANSLPIVLFAGAVVAPSVIVYKKVLPTISFKVTTKTTTEQYTKKELDKHLLKLWTEVGHELERPGILGGNLDGLELHRLLSSKEATLAGLLAMKEFNEDPTKEKAEVLKKQMKNVSKSLDPDDETAVWLLDMWSQNKKVFQAQIKEEEPVVEVEEVEEEPVFFDNEEEEVSESTFQNKFEEAMDNAIFTYDRDEGSWLPNEELEKLKVDIGSLSRREEKEFYTQLNKALKEAGCTERTIDNVNLHFLELRIEKRLKKAGIDEDPASIPRHTIYENRKPLLQAKALIEEFSDYYEHEDFNADLKERLDKAIIRLEQATEKYEHLFGDEEESIAASPLEEFEDAVTKHEFLDKAQLKDHLSKLNAEQEEIWYTRIGETLDRAGFSENDKRDVDLLVLELRIEKRLEKRDSESLQEAIDLAHNFNEYYKDKGFSPELKRRLKRAIDEQNPVQGG